MKRSPAAVKELSKPSAPQDYYPLTLYLGKDAIEKLGLEKAGIGDERMLLAKVKVSSISASEREGGEAHHSLTLTIEEAATGSVDKRSSAEKIYGKK